MDYLDNIVSFCNEWFAEPQELLDYQDLKQIGLLQYPVFHGFHLGQRKLFLNEVLFYNKLPKGITVIYSGSANGEHTPLILDMFPYINFIFVDPNFHWMKYQYRYIYKDASKVDPQNKKEFLSKASYFKNIKCLDDQVRDVLNCPSFGSFAKPDFDKSRVWIIQDYMTPELGNKIRDAFGDEPLYHISDIRTSIEQKGIPTDLDYLYNNALQVLILKSLKPILSHLKFRLPNWNTKESLVNIPKWVMDTFEECKRYGLDILDDYQKGKYKYMDGDIYVQPWGPAKTMESRLVTKGEAFIYYDYTEYRSKFNYVNSCRTGAFYPRYYNLVKGKMNNQYDASLDCALEIKILMDFCGDPNYVIYLSYKIDEVTRHPFNNPKKGVNRIRILELPKSFKFGYEVDYVKHMYLVENGKLIKL